MTVVGLVPDRGATAAPDDPAARFGRFLEQRDVGQPGGMVDQVDRAGTFAGRVIVAPTGARSSQMNDAGALVPRRTAGEIGAAQRLAVGRQARVRKQCAAAIRLPWHKAARESRRGRTGRGGCQTSLRSIMTGYQSLLGAGDRGVEPTGRSTGVLPKPVVPDDDVLPCELLDALCPVIAQPKVASVSMRLFFQSRS